MENTVYLTFTEDVATEDRNKLMPYRATRESAAFDLKAHDLKNGDSLESFHHGHYLHYLRPGERRIYRTGIRLLMNAGTHALVLPRSGMAIKHGITVINSPGLIDSDYIDEIMVGLVNHDDQDVVISRFDRIAQILFQPYTYETELELYWDEDFESLRRDRDGGLGSTGK